MTDDGIGRWAVATMPKQQVTKHNGYVLRHRTRCKKGYKPRDLRPLADRVIILLLCLCLLTNLSHNSQVTHLSAPCGAETSLASKGLGPFGAAWLFCGSRKKPADSFLSQRLFCRNPTLSRRIPKCSCVTAWSQPFLECTFCLPIMSPIISSISYSS